MENNSMGELYTALSKAQGEFPDLPKTKTAKIKGFSKKTNKPYEMTYRYATLSDIRKGVQSSLSKYGLSIVQVIQDEKLVTMLCHSAGAMLKSEMFIDLKQTPQSLGSNLTYYRRYALSAILGVAADEDDDGQMAQTSKPTYQPKPQTPPQSKEAQDESIMDTIREIKGESPGTKEWVLIKKKEVMKLSEMRKWPIESVLRLIKKETGKDSLDDATPEQFNTICNFIEQNSAEVI